MVGKVVSIRISISIALSEPLGSLKTVYKLFHEIKKIAFGMCLLSSAII